MKAQEAKLPHTAVRLCWYKKCMSVANPIVKCSCLAAMQNCPCRVTESCFECLQSSSRLHQDFGPTPQLWPSACQGVTAGTAKLCNQQLVHGFCLSTSMSPWAAAARLYHVSICGVGSGCRITPSIAVHAWQQEHWKVNIPGYIARIDRRQWHPLQGSTNSYSSCDLDHSMVDAPGAGAFLNARRNPYLLWRWRGPGSLCSGQQAKWLENTETSIC